jgi:DNA-binding response OmpR family regulator
VLRAGDVVLDPAAHTVSVAGADVVLTTREFALLEYLVRRPGQVVPKAELFEHVWEGGDEAAGLNIVEVYIGYVRRKIGRDAIETVRGAGYRVSPAPES